MTSLAMQPYDYQREDMKFLVQLKKGALLHEPGVGKTFGALLAMTYVLETEGGKALIIMPPVLLDTWYEKIYSYFDTGLKTLIYRGTPKARKAFKLEEYDIVIASYNIFQIDYIVFKDSRFSIIIADETKYIKNGVVSKSKKTGRMNKFGCTQSLIHKAKYVTLMNGTPVTKSPEDLFHIIQLLNPNIYVTKKNFLRNHAKYMPNELGYPQIVGWKNLEGLEQILKGYSRRLIKSEVLELPKKQLIIKQFNLESSHQKQLKELWDFGFVELDEDNIFLEGMALMMEVRRALIDPSLLGINKKSTYLEVLEDLLDDLKGEQIILFAHFHKSMDLIEEVLKAKGISYSPLHGRVSAKNKQKAVDGFKTKKFDVLLANAKSAGVGLDFPQCHNVIFLELDYEVDSFWQGQDRVHRPGQTEEVNIFVFIARNTPAVKLFRGIKTNIDFVKELLAGKEDASTLFEDKITVQEEESWKNI